MENVPSDAVTMKKHHHVENVHVEKGRLGLMVDGRRIQCELKELSPLLAAAKEEALNVFEVSPSGYGIHWPLINEDISIDGLLGIVHAPSSDRKGMSFACLKLSGKVWPHHFPTAIFPLAISAMIIRISLIAWGTLAPSATTAGITTSISTSATIIL